MLLRFPNIQTGCSQSTAYPCSSHTKHLQQLLRPELACRRWRQHHAAGPAIAAPTPRLVAVASSSDWSPAQPSASSYDWHVSSGAGSYADPRLAPGYRPAQPASYPSPHQTGGQQHAEAGPFQDGPSSSFDASQVRMRCHMADSHESMSGSATWLEVTWGMGRFTLHPNNTTHVTATLFAPQPLSYSHLQKTRPLPCPSPACA